MLNKRDGRAEKKKKMVLKYSSRHWLEVTLIYVQVADCTQIYTAV